ncbi:MAG TPA: chromate resistance protein ChrB domain-containing protein [bacterium]|nr:chromate resistance protein ChrB domain-containing protein [bacterium]
MAWVVFSYSLPSTGRSSPRVTMWRRLRTLGAVSPKGGVHVLPARGECVEAFQWLAQEVEQANGEALLMWVERFEGLSDAHLIELFQGARRKEYESLGARAAGLEKSLRVKAPRTARAEAKARDLLARLRREHGEIARTDFFGAPAGIHAAAALARVEQALAPAPTADPRIPPAAVAAYRDKRWVTRPHPHVDRLACAWLIRRFINPRAQIRYSTTAAPEEVAFDMRGATFGHRGSLCTFETMLKAFGLDDPGLRAIAEIVHEIDLRDGRYVRLEGPGVDAILKGWQVLPDAEREVHGLALFDGLHAALSQSPRTTSGRRRSAR